MIFTSSARLIIVGSLFIDLHTASAGDVENVAMDSLPAARWHFGGVVGERIDANERAWLMTAPGANPGMLEMFRQRDRQPPQNLVDWAGEFAGKYLISAVQAMRMSARPELREHIAAFVRDLIATQAEDGYLGPFPKSERLLGRWDLWGHYHVIEGLLLWHEETGDAAALAAARRAADLACRIFLRGEKRVLDAGSHEMNMAFIHALTLLHRHTGEQSYLDLAREIEKDWEKAGDYLRTGVAGVEFYATPKPRWESLHDLQGLAEMWRITGEAKYRQAFEHHWRSILRGDVHNAGSFSAGEQATGDPWADGAIETCCTIAWMAISVDMLRLTGDPLVADELERSTFNGAIGAQHPSGRWWTYNTPMDGVREASAHSIVFQARAGTPELNCCSVNGPRALGMLSDWAVMKDASGLTINWLGPLDFTLPARNGEAARISCETDYPLGNRIRWKIAAVDGAQEIMLRFRVPAWSGKNTARLNGEPLPAPKGGAYLELRRHWKAGDIVELDLDFSVRAMAGDREQFGRVSLFRGPLLLAWDAADHAPDDPAPSPIRNEDIARATVIPPSHSWLLVEVPCANGKTVRLRDFANAGAAGTRYRSWLPSASYRADPAPLIVPLRSDAKPDSGRLIRANGFAAGDNALRLDGRSQMLLYALPADFGKDFTVAVSVRIFPETAPRPSQIFSAWCAPLDDPLRLVFEKGQLSARIEAGRGYSTKNIPLESNVWHHVAAVKNVDRLTLFVDGHALDSIAVPSGLATAARDCAIGGNPHFTGPEFLAGEFRSLFVRSQASSAAEIEALAAKSALTP